MVWEMTGVSDPQADLVPGCVHRYRSFLFVCVYVCVQQQCSGVCDVFYVMVSHLFRRIERRKKRRKRR